MKLFVIILSGLLASCANMGPKLSCEGTNWYELGRQAGRQGKSLKNQWDLKSICGNDRSLYQQKFAILETGYHSGLSEFCSPENAFSLGRLGLENKAHCPERFQERYMASFKSGQRFAQIEQNTLNTDKKIEQLSSELGDAGLSLAKRALREGQRLELLDEKNSQLSRLRTLQESAELSQARQ